MTKFTNPEGFEHHNQNHNPIWDNHSICGRVMLEIEVNGRVACMCKW